MFPTEFGPSFTAHLSSSPETPISSPRRSPKSMRQAGCRGAATHRPARAPLRSTRQRVERFNGPFPCFSQFPTLAERLDAAGVSWKYYAAPLRRIGGKVWSEFDSVRAVRYGPDWKNVISPQTRVLRGRAVRSARERFVGYTRLEGFGSHRQRLQRRSIVGRFDRQCDRREPILELDRNHCALG